jgi:glutathione synthase/RimK-type ligase-like ATP-grasp enzyme
MLCRKLQEAALEAKCEDRVEFNCIIMPDSSFLPRFIDSVRELSAVDDPLALLLAERTRKNNSLSNVGQSDKCVLILTHDYDPEVTLLTIKLRSRGINCVRLNTNDIANEELKVKFSISPEDPKLNIEFAVGQYELDPSRISAILLRQFDLKEVNFNGNEVVRAFLFQQWAHALQTLQSNMTCDWINSPYATIHAADRIRQLSAAQNIGFDIPSTVITNDSTTAKDFYRLHNGNIILKALHEHSVVVGTKIYSGYARKINDSELLELDKGLAAAPCILQQKLIKRSELRVTVIGEEVFAAELGSNFLCDDQDIDIHHYLGDNNFPIEKVESLPDKILNGCISLVKSLGLKYGAIDFAVEKQTNRPIFLEINPTGEWHWIEAKTGLRMTDAVANLIQDYIH